MSIEGKKTSVKDIIDQENKIWLNDTQIAALAEEKTYKDCATFLYVLCMTLFPNTTPMVQEKTSKNILIFIRGLYKSKGIKEPEHWSPINDVLKKQTFSEQLPGINCFNAAIRNLRLYLTPDQSLVNLATADITERKRRCEGMLAEMDSVFQEISVLQKKLDDIRIQVEAVPMEKNRILQIIDGANQQISSTEPQKKKARSKTTI